MADYQNLSAPELNQINGSSSALGEGSFRRRDELRRAESVQRNRVRMSERLDRNITCAVRKGDARSASAFNALKESITGQGYMGGGGIVNAEDQQDRVKDGAVKAADTRYNIGNIGNTNPADGPIANAPPPAEGRPRVVGQFPPGSDLEKAEKDLWTKPKPGARHDDEYMSMDVPQSVKDSIAGPQTAPEAAPAPSASPSATPQPQGSIADVSAKRAAVAKLRNKWAAQKAQDEAPEKAKEQARLDYEAKNGAPNTSSMEGDRYVDNAILNLDRSKFSPEQIKAIRKNMEGLSVKDREDAVATGKKTASPKPARVPSADDIAFGERVGAAAGKVKDGVDSLGKKIDGSLNDAAARRATYEKNEAERLRKRNEGMAAVDSKLGKELERADQWGAAQKKMSADYFADSDATEARNKAYTDDLSSANPLRSVPAAFRGGLFDNAVEPSPVMPTPIDYASFDPANPPKYQRQLPPKQVYKAPAYTGKGYADNDMSQRAILYRQSQAQASLKTYTQPPSNPPPL